MPFLTVSSSKTMLEASLLSLVDSETVACCHDTILAPSLLLYIKLLCSRKPPLYLVSIKIDPARFRSKLRPRRALV